MASAARFTANEGPTQLNSSDCTRDGATGTYIQSLRVPPGRRSKTSWTVQGASIENPAAIIAAVRGKLGDCHLNGVERLTD